MTVSDVGRHIHKGNGMGEINIDAYAALRTLPDRSLALRIVDEAI